MLKIILIIDCDICSQSFERIATSTDRHPQAWDYLSLDLEAKAENYGWNCHSVHHCDYCTPDMEFDCDHVSDASTETSTENDSESGCVTNSFVSSMYSPSTAPQANSFSCRRGGGTAALAMQPNIPLTCRVNVSVFA